jgi:cytochrome c
MSSFEINKIAGAILIVGLFVMVVGFIGDALVKPDHYVASAVKVQEAAAPAAKMKPEPLPLIAPLLAKADAAAGKGEARKCAGCHALNKGGKAKAGPPLWNIVGGALGSFPGYSYSKALKAKGGNWDYETLNAFLAAPKKYIKGTKMGFKGVKKANSRANLIMFMRSQADSPVSLP